MWATMRSFCAKSMVRAASLRRASGGTGNTPPVSSGEKVLRINGILSQQEALSGGSITAPKKLLQLGNRILAQALVFRVRTVRLLLVGDRTEPVCLHTPCTQLRIIGGAPAHGGQRNGLGKHALLRMLQCTGRLLPLP